MYNLPVSAQEPDQRLYMHGGSNPVPPQTEAAGMLSQQDLYDLHVELINVLQEKAHARHSAVRIFMFNMYAANDYNNPQYLALYDRAAMYCAFLRFRGDHDAVTKAANETLITETPAILQAYPALQQFLNQQQVFDIQKNAGYRQEIGVQIENWINQRMGSPNMQQQQMYQQQPMMQQPSFQQQPMSGGWNAPQSQRRPMAAVGGQSSLDQMVNAGMSGQSAPAQQSSVRRPSIMSTFDTTEKPVPSAAAVSTPVSEHYIHPIPEMEELVFYPMPPAVHEGQTLTERVVKNKIEYAIVNKDPVMNYEDHENNMKMIDLARGVSGGPSRDVAVNWEAVGNTAIISETAEGEDFEELTENSELMKMINDADTTIVNKEVYAALSITHGRVLVTRDLRMRGIENISDHILEYYLKIYRPIVSNDKEIALIAELRGSADATDMVDAFRAMKDDLNFELWHVIHNRLTKVFNEKLASTANIKWTIGSIVDDYEDALQALTEDLNGAGADRFRHKVYIAMVQSLGTDTFEDKREGEDDGTHNALTEMVSVTQLPWTGGQIGLKMPSEYAMLTEAVDPNMYDACRAIMDRTSDKKLGINRRLLVTADDKWIALHSGVFSADTLIVSQVMS